MKPGGIDPSHLSHKELELLFWLWVFNGKHLQLPTTITAQGAGYKHIQFKMDRGTVIRLIHKGLAVESNTVHQRTGQTGSTGFTITEKGIQRIQNPSLLFVQNIMEM